MASKPKYCIGQLIHHNLFHYQGVVLGVGLTFQESEQWDQ